MNQYENTFESLMADGFTARMARDYLATLDAENHNDMFDPAYRAWAHKHGFTAESACAYGLTEQNADAYLSDYDYARLWPLNDWERIWINDKLTLNALTEGTELARYVPRYFYYRDSRRLLPLSGSEYAPGIDGFISCLKQEGTFACKPSNGSTSLGFHRIEYRNDSFFLDGEPCDERAIHQFVEEHPNYVFTEFIHPESSLAAINPLIHTLRILVVNPTGIDPVPTIGYLRFAVDDGSSGTGKNYVAPTSADIASYNVEVDLATGHYGNAKLVYGNRVIDAPEHPTSGVLVEGTLPYWDELLDMLMALSLKVGACEYLGFDACITTKGPMIMEINSHTGIKYLQLFKPVLDDSVLRDYYHDKLETLDRMSASERERRTGIVR